MSARPTYTYLLRLHTEELRALHLLCREMRLPISATLRALITREAERIVTETKERETRDD